MVTSATLLQVREGLDLDDSDLDSHEQVQQALLMEVLRRKALGREARFLSRCSHPNIIRVLGVVQRRGETCPSALVMPRAEGGSLLDRLRCPHSPTHETSTLGVAG